MKGRNNGYTLLASLGLLAVFAGLILWVLLGGAGAYRRLTERSGQAFDRSACVRYIATKVWQAPQEVQTDTFGTTDALVIPQTYGDIPYLTRIYCHDGWLMELFAPASGEFAPEDGERLIPAKELSFSLEDGLLKAQFTDESGGERTLLLDLRTGEVLP